MNENPTASFGGLQIAAFESRRASEMASLIERNGGVPWVSPSMREVPLDDNPIAIDFAKSIMTGGMEIVILLTGVGFELLLAAVERQVDRDRFVNSLADITTIVRGPKPAAALRKIGIRPTYTVPAPNTWREVLLTVDQSLSVDSQRVGLQEYGKTNPSLVAGLEARGARVVRVPVYQWDVPEDTEPLESNIHRMIAGQCDAALFTSAQQFAHLQLVADRIGQVAELDRALRNTVIGSIGPTTSEAISEAGYVVDFEPTVSKMGQFVREAAAALPGLIERKARVSTTLSGPASHPADCQAPWYDSPFMKACRGEPSETVPVWLMRQAGRYLPEYRAIREKTTFLELCKNPALCAEIMVTTVQRLGVDAAIIFSDLLPILEPMGLDLEYAQGEGPVIHNPIRADNDVDRIRRLDSVDSLDFVMETVRQTRSDLPADIPLIGFAGAPFTLASYAIEGGSSRNYLHTKTMMYRDSGAWRALMERFVASVTIYLNAQIAAGAQCVQLFDSWAGCLGPEDYRVHVAPYVQDLIAGITPGVPVINFATGNPALLPLLAEGNQAVIGIDWRIGLRDGWERIGFDRAVQGNLDPTVLFAERRHVCDRAQAILSSVAGRPGHIFNLGHGVLPATPVDNVLALIDCVHEFRVEGAP